MIINQCPSYKHSLNYTIYFLSHVRTSTLIFGVAKAHFFNSKWIPYDYIGDPTNLYGPSINLEYISRVLGHPSKKSHKILLLEFSRNQWCLEFGPNCLQRMTQAVNTTNSLLEASFFQEFILWICGYMTAGYYFDRMQLQSVPQVVAVAGVTNRWVSLQACVAIFDIASVKIQIRHAGLYTQIGKLWHYLDQVVYG